MADSTGITPSHGLFRLIWSYAFTDDEQCALCIYVGKEIPINPEQLHRVTTTSIINGWKELTPIIVKFASAHQLKINLNEVLSQAAYGGHIHAMKEAYSMGAWNVKLALMHAARGGRVEAMKEARSMGATDFDGALVCAAQEGQVEAMREARTMGATRFNWALEWAVRGGHIETITESCSMGATKFNTALILAQTEDIRGHIRKLMAER